MNDRMEVIRQNHQDPVNVAMHGLGFLFIARAIWRLLRGRRLSALLFGGVGLGLLIAGHRMEGTEPFSVFRETSSSPAANL